MTSACPSLEDIAAFVDGRLPAAERARIVEHMARCPDCYAVMATTVEFLEQEEAGGAQEGEGDEEDPADRAVAPPRPTVPQPLATVVPLHPPTAPRARSGRDWSWTYRMAAALVVGVLGGALLFPLLRDKEPRLSTSEMLAGTSLGQKTFTWAGEMTNRGLGHTSEELSALVRLGAGMVDLQLWLQAADPEEGLESIAHDFRTKSEDFPFDSLLVEEIKAFADRLDGDPGPGLAGEAEALDRKIFRSLEADGLTLEYNLGKWAEAGRLAALARNQDHFTPRSRKYLRWLVKHPETVQPEVEETLGKVAALVKKEPLTKEDFDLLAERFDSILRSYETRSR